MSEHAHLEVDRRLVYRQPTPATVAVHERVRAAVRDLAYLLVDALPPGRHASLAQTALQEALLWANAAIACDTPDPTEETDQDRYRRFLLLCDCQAPEGTEHADRCAARPKFTGLLNQPNIEAFDPATFLTSTRAVCSVCSNTFDTGTQSANCPHQLLAGDFNQGPSGAGR